MTGGLEVSRRALLAAGAAAGTLWTMRAAAADPEPDMLGRLEARAVGTRALREIKRLQHAWAHYAEAGQWREIAGLMARDGVVVLPSSTVTGREAVHAHLRDTMGEGQDGLPADRLNIRLFLSPVITLAPDGRSARGRWHEVAMTGHYGRSAQWAGGIHENVYVLEDGVWKISRLHYHPQFAGPYERGWRNLAASTPLVPYHYDPAGAGTPVPPALTVTPGEGDERARLERLDREAETLLAASAVQNLQAAYGFYVDRKMWDDVADLFAPEATLETGEGSVRGRDAIRDRFGAAGLSHGELNEHPQLMPIVTVAADGRTARLRGIEVAMTGRHGGESFWTVSVHDNDYVCRDGRWMIAAMRIIPRMHAAYDKGWAKDLPPLPGASAYPSAPPRPVTLDPVLAPEAALAGTGAAPADVERKLAVAVAFDGAENVSNAYGYYIDEFRWDETADLFAEDGWKELSYIGTYVGRERVRQSLFSRYGRAGRSPAFLAIHQKTQPYVTVAPDGRRANIRLRLFQFNSQVDGDGSYISGIYENQVTLEDGVWKIHGMDLDYVWLGDYTGGFAAIEPGSSRRFAPTPEAVAKYPPDGPLRGVTFAPFPEVAPMGFHFRNPVSGREPPLLLQWSDGRFGSG